MRLILVCVGFLAAAAAGAADARLTERCDVNYGNGEVQLEVRSSQAFGALEVAWRGRRHDPDVFERLWEPRAASFEDGAITLTFDRVQDTAQIAASIVADPVLAGLGVVQANADGGWFCNGVPPGVVNATMTEYYNSRLDRYRFSSSPAENAALDKGAAGGGWRRTGEIFATIEQQGCYGAQPVFRFYNPASRAQYLTTDPDECGLLRRSPTWVYEGEPFGARHPVGGQCPAPTTPVYLLANDKSAFNYRYVARAPLRDSMIGKGWALVDVAMCLVKRPY